MSRATIIWFVGAAIVGAVAGGLHLLRSAIGGSHTGLPITVAAFGLTVVAAAMLFHGVMQAAREQDAAAGPLPRVPAGRRSDDEVQPLGPDDRTAPAEGPDVYTFRAGKPIVPIAPRAPRASRPAPRDRPPRS